ncbi:unnamed protein product [Zymoseptoria tritici ST99CH_1A5]|nr:unnamed protein product [Zymoseptoria tritici ST99CH_3D1]SMY29835.1 unnamed protein product [Zymoseptoria tritici ST99CH_1A5]
MSRGKRSIQLDLDSAEGKDALRRLLRDADVLIQSYRPGSLAAKGLITEEILAICPDGIVVANLSAWGEAGPWKDARGFDSMVQTVSGLNTDDADGLAATGGGEQDGSPAKVLPVQALDHASGYLLATGTLAALWRRAKEGGSREVGVSLEGTGRLGRGRGREDVPFEGKGVKDVASTFLQERETKLGT